MNCSEVLSWNYHFPWLLLSLEFTSQMVVRGGTLKKVGLQIRNLKAIRAKFS